MKGMMFAVPLGTVQYGEIPNLFDFGSKMAFLGPHDGLRNIFFFLLCLPIKMYFKSFKAFIYKTSFYVLKSRQKTGKKGGYVGHFGPTST